LGLTSPRRAVLGFVRFIEDYAVVEFGQWNIDADSGMAGMAQGLKPTQRYFFAL
jgi:hypothetical protein